MKQNRKKQNTQSETLNRERTESAMLIEVMDVKGVIGNNSWIKLSNNVC